ncbi:MAG: hypothetical protein AAB215_06235 [Planctomycetota bacterium]
MKRPLAAFACLVAAGTLFSVPPPLPAALAPGKAVAWEPVGLSGGGAMFSPAISPSDPDRMMVHCDMGAAYLTKDGGKSWRMIPTTALPSNTRCRPAFHPTDPDAIYSAGGWGGRLFVTRDFGSRWQALGNIEGNLCGEIAIDPDAPERILAGTEDGAWRSTDGGKSWTRCEGPKGECVGFHFDRTTPKDRRAQFAATKDGVWRSDDGGRTWAEKANGLPWRELRSFAGGSDAKGAILYAAIPSKSQGGRYEGGVYRSTDRGETWASAMGSGLNKETKAFDEWAMGDVAQYHVVLATNADPSKVWAMNANTGIPPPHHTAAFRSDDAGKTWHPTFFPDPRWKPFNVERDYTVCEVSQFYQDVPIAAVNPANPDQVVQVDGGRCYVTRDGGKTWTAAHTRPAPGPAPGKGSDWLCNGLVVTTTWHHYIDPFEPKRRYIPYTDSGFARSLDEGKTWKWWSLDGRAPWPNTCYELAFDPEIPGKIWGAFSNVHDIPNGNIIWNRHRSEGAGGICLSTDFAAAWKPLKGGLPEAPATAIVLDPKSPKGRRTLYAGFFGKGVYKSVDDGKTWAPKSKGLGAPSNLRVARVQRHPDGTLFALVTAKVKEKTFAPEGVGLYRSKDGAETWQAIAKAPAFLWPKDFALDPADSRVAYLGAADANGKQIGGLYRTDDGGVRWTLLARKGPEHFGAALHPKRPGFLYMTLCEDAPGGGLFLSKDNGKTFKPATGLPFNNIMRVTFDPADDSILYVSTFGGSVWRGPAEW